jgi:hypothetical protein
MLELIFHCLIFGVFAIVGLLLLFLWRAVYDQQFDFHLWATQQRRRQDDKTVSPEVIELVERGLQMMRGDQEALIRLAANQFCKHPDRSDVWVWEKVIYDLERDRRP